MHSRGSSVGRRKQGLAFLFGSMAVASGFTATPAAITFNEHIQPILSENCYHCHGSDAHSRKAELRLDREETAVAPRKEGAAIVRGQPDQSLLIRRVESQDSKYVMPPPESHKTLQPEEIVLLRRWVKDGAVYQQHWAWTAPVRPELPGTGGGNQQERGKTKNTPSVRPGNPIDVFIRARLAEDGLTLSPEADKHALIRRATFDLTGLPPTPEAITEFVADTSPQAYERLVDRLLASPRYGEHRAHYWLDAARYSDTHGLHIDNFRLQWPYRDYVIRSFNANKRFDRFGTEQIAGDLLPVESFDQLVATGFLRAHQTTSESGEVTEELQLANTNDRTETVATVFLGLTAACATCHDHKFDPIAQKDFYSLGAFFNNTRDPPFDDEEASFFPTLTLPSPERTAEAQAILAQQAAADRLLAERTVRAPDGIREWLAGGTPDLHPVSPEQLVARFRFDEAGGDKVRNSAPGAEPAEYAFEQQPPFWGEHFKFWPTMRFAASSVLRLGQVGDFDTNDAFSVSGWFQPRVGRNKKSGSLVTKMSVADKNCGWEMFWDDATTPQVSKFQRYPEGFLTLHLNHQEKENDLVVRTTTRISRLDWAHLAFTYDGSGKAAGVRLYVSGEAQPVEVVRDRLTGSIRTAAPLQLGRRTSPAERGEKFVKIDADALPETSYQDLRIYARPLSAAEIRGTMHDDVVSEIIRHPAAQWSEDQRRIVTDFYLQYVDTTAMAARRERAQLDRQLAAVTAGGVRAMICQERGEIAMNHVRERGAYNRLKERVLADVPGFLPPLPPGAPRNRLGLAQWLFAPQNPLTARVTVNRMWQEIFGTGLVATPRDFGTVGARPSHFQLLDWLAVDFRASGWDVKRFYKQLLMSATYRQSARVSPQLLELDPANRLLSRGPRYRLDAEMIRDAALAASGLLVEREGGPSVNSYQPPGLWEALSMDRSNTRTHQRDAGDGLYRRSVYTFWKRMAPPPVLTTFDAPQRDVCTVQRERTNTPLQALIVLNSPDFNEAARHLAVRVLHETDRSVDQRIDLLAALVLTRPLNPADRTALRQTLEALRGDFTEAEANQFLAQGDSKVDPSLPVVEQAAWTVVASQILNTDQAVNK